MAGTLCLSLSKTFEFAAAHRLYREEWSAEQNARVFSKCANPNSHGHNYKLEVYVSGTIDQDTGMIIDSSVLQKLVDELILREVDHRNLDMDVDWLRGKVTTIENIISAFWHRLEPAIHNANQSVQLEKLVLWETSKIFATLERKS